MKQNKLSKGDKALIAIFELSKNKNTITVEDIAVKLWEMYPSEFSMRGYSKFPNVDIQKHITKLLKNNLVRGGVYNYKLTDKGKTEAQNLILVDNEIGDNKKDESKPNRDVKIEIDRILKSKVFNYYKKSGATDFLESDLFEFLGTSARSFSTGAQYDNTFLLKYNLLLKDIIPFCEKNRSDPNLSKIIDLWKILTEKFKELINRRVK